MCMIVMALEVLPKDCEFTLPLPSIAGSED